MDMTLDAPLSEQEIDEMEAFLESDATPHERMTINRARRLSHRLGDRPESPASEPLDASHLGWPE
jgi:hypothetical protein